MAWYYSESGNQRGPVEEAALDDLVRQGVVRDDTLVWREGMANWLPHAAARGAQPFSPPPAIPSFVTPFVTRRYAGFWIRFVALIIDGIILNILTFLIRLPFGLMIGARAIGLGTSRDPSSDVLAAIPMLFGMASLAGLIGIVVTVLYEAYFVSAKGGTPGKLALGLKIIRADGGPVPPGLAVGRYFAQWVSAIILGIGFLMAGWDSEKRALHDRICDTRVVYSR